MKVIKNTTSGLYFITGKGLVAKSAAEASKFTEASIGSTMECLTNCGLGPVVAENVASDPNIQQNYDGISYAVSFVRPKQLRSDGSINTHKLNPSKRRFRTHDEAVHHGSRFMAIEKHLGFYVTTTRDPVNAYVNRVTGKTNPEVGKARTNR